MMRFLTLFSLLATSISAQYVIPSGYTNTFQVHSQFSSSGATSSTNQTVLQFTFGSNGQTSSATLTPPADKSFTAVSFTLQNVGKGVQYDRLIHVALTTDGQANWVEVWRSSTFEPTSNGVYSTYTKDMTGFISLLKSTQTLQMNMDNYVDQTYTGNFAVQITATYYYGAKQTAVPPTAIFPASGNSGGTSSSGPKGFGTARGVGSGGKTDDRFDNSTVTLPRNTNKAIVQVFASGAYTGCGSSGNSEEFWWASRANSDVSFREIQVYIDGNIAGVGFPVPIVYTGGISPGYWRPIVAINAYDAYALPIDISPFLGTLTDGNAHQISIGVAGIPSNLDCGAGWYLGGRVETWQDASISQSTITGFTSNIQAAASPSSANSANSQSFTRKHTTSATINGKAYNYAQSLSFSNTVGSSTGFINQQTSGTDTTNGINTQYSWPITYNGTRSLTSSQTQLSLEFHLSSLGIHTSQTAKAITQYRTSYGTNTQTYSDATGYSRSVKASMGSVTSDSNPSLKRREHARDLQVLEDRALPPFLQALLAGPLGDFFEGKKGVSAANLALIEAAIGAVGGFDPNVAPPQVVFAPITKLSAGPLL